MESNVNQSNIYGGPRQKTRAVDKRVIQQGEEIYNAIQMIFQFASFPIQSPLFIIDPYQAAPLSAIAGIKTTTPTQITVTVLGKNGSQGNISHTFPGYSTEHLVPVLGLYPGYDNQVVLEVADEQGVILSNTLTATTEPLDVETFGTVDIISPAQMDKLDNNVLYITLLQNAFPSATDLEGEVRWLFKEHYDEGFPINLFSGIAFYELNNGRLLGRHTDYFALCEFDPVGRIYRIIDTDFNIHHDVVQMPNGNLLIQSEDPTRESQEDMLSIMNYETEEIIHEIDFKDIFDPTIPPQPDLFAREGFTDDWWHENSIEYDIAHNVYITSSRHQNVVVATDMDTNAIHWMLGSPTRWPERFQQYFLTPVNENGDPIYDFDNPEDVAAADRDFWNWAQHSAKIFTDDGNPDTLDIMLFNNGPYRSYDSERWIPPYQNWSNAPHFRINTVNMTVQLLWDFGKDLDTEYYSGYVGNVQYMSETNSLWINFGGTNVHLPTGLNVGQPGDVPMPDLNLPEEWWITESIQEKVRIVEVDMDTKEILFAFDRYLPETLGVFQSYQYKGMKADLYTKFYNE